MPALQSTTASWTNVNTQTYIMGTTIFKYNAYTGCNENLSCTTNIYTLSEKTARARMITVQEATALGCSRVGHSCPIWMINYFLDSTEHGGTVNDSKANYDYWTMSASLIDSLSVFVVSRYGHLYGESGLFAARTSSKYTGTRAVVVINK